MKSSISFKISLSLLLVLIPFLIYTYYHGLCHGSRGHFRL